MITVTVLLLALAGCGRLIPGAPSPVGPRPYSPTPGPQPSRPGPSVYVAPGSGVIDRGIDGGTQARVQQATRTLDQCRAELAASRVTFSPTPDRVNSETCGLTAAGVLGPDMGTVARMAPGDVTMTCALSPHWLATRTPVIPN